MLDNQFKSMKRVFVAIIIGAFYLIIFLPISLFAQGASVTLDHVEGLAYPSVVGAYPEIYLNVNKPIIFKFRITNSTGNNITGTLNPYIFYSNDSVQWQIFSFNWNPDVDWSNYVEELVFSPPISDGISPDTIVFLSHALIEDGLPTGFSEIAHIIETEISDAYRGKEICVDSVTWGGVAAPWLWIESPGFPLVPDWDGPHCFVIGCCNGSRGDVNYDGSNVNILDLTFSVDFIFRGGLAPPCWEEADVNGDGSRLNIIDLTYVLDRIFRGGPVPVGCP